jgi:PPOX class probable F420-dependent enzyme
MNRDEAIRRLHEAPVGRMATVRPDGTPHVVPFVFAFITADDGSIHLYWMVDDKPKRTPALRRIANLRSNPAVEVLVDRYDDDWTVIWWVRARGTGRVVSSVQERSIALEALAGKYPQYGSANPAGEIIAIDVETVAGWSARDLAGQ